MENGINVPHSAESEIVRRIFADYLGGGSLKTIAEALAAEKIEFITRRSDWNKHRVKRILEDERYTGTNTYPAVISADMYRQARARKDLNNKTATKSECRFRPSCSVECARCGTEMKRRRGMRGNLPHEIWTCQNPDCHAILCIGEDALPTDITELLNRLIADPGLVDTDALPTAESPEARRLANEADRELDSFAFDKDKEKQLLFALAAERYKNIDSRAHQGCMMRAEFENSKPLSSFSPELFKRTVLKIQLGQGFTRLILKNHQAIERSEPYADRNRNEPATGNAG
jgi:hypothetical protein